MAIKSRELVIGRFYDFTERLPAVPSARDGNGQPSLSMPALQARRTGQLIDKRSNGVLIFQVDYVTWDYPCGWDGDHAVAHMMSANKKPVTKTRLVKAKAPQVVGLAKTQPSNRVPNPADRAVA